MRIFVLYVCVLFRLYAPPSSVFASENRSDWGAVSGMVRVWKTKVKTKGPKRGKDVVVYLEEANGDSFLAVDGLVCEAPDAVSISTGAVPPGPFSSRFRRVLSGVKSKLPAEPTQVRPSSVSWQSQTKGNQ